MTTNKRGAGKYIITVGDRFWTGPSTTKSQIYAAVYTTEAAAQAALDGIKRDNGYSGLLSPEQAAAARVVPWA